MQIERWHKRLWNDQGLWKKTPYNIRNENAIELNGNNAEYKFAALSQEMVTSA